MGNRNVIINQLRTIMAENMRIAVPQTLKETDRLFEDLNIDSIMLLQLVVYMEEFFNLSIPEEEIHPAAFQTVGSLVTFIESLR